MDPALERIWRSLPVVILGCAVTSLSGMSAWSWDEASGAQGDGQAEPWVVFMAPCSCSTIWAP